MNIFMDSSASDIFTCLYFNKNKDWTLCSMLFYDIKYNMLSAGSNKLTINRAEQYISYIIIGFYNRNEREETIKIGLNSQILPVSDYDPNPLTPTDTKSTDSTDSTSSDEEKSLDQGNNNSSKSITPFPATISDDSDYIDPKNEEEGTKFSTNIAIPLIIALSLLIIICSIAYLRYKDKKKKKANDLQGNQNIQQQQVLVQNAEVRFAPKKDVDDGPSELHDVQIKLPDDILQEMGVEPEENFFLDGTFHYEAQEDQINLCLVCFQKFNAGAKLKRLRCTHCFHKECATKLSRKKKCPFCELRGKN